MSRWWGVRHIRWWYLNWQFTRWWLNCGRYQAMFRTNPHESYLDAVWRGEA